MILYSIMPPEIVFGNMEEIYREFKEIEYMGERVVVSPLSNSECEIVRIISSSLTAYLNPRLQPGERIKASWK